jgi:hypothetical protein
MLSSDFRGPIKIKMSEIDILKLFSSSLEGDIYKDSPLRPTSI